MTATFLSADKNQHQTERVAVKTSCYVKTALSPVTYSLSQHLCIECHPRVGRHSERHKGLKKQNQKNSIKKQMCLTRSHMLAMMNNDALNMGVQLWL